MRSIKEMDKRLDEREQEIEQLQQAKDNLQKDYQEAVDKINNMKLDIDQAQEIIIELQQENKQLKEDLRVSQSNEETYCLEMQEITKILGLDEHTLFDDVKYYAKQLKKELEKQNTFGWVLELQDRIDKAIDYIEHTELYEVAYDDEGNYFNTFDDKATADLLQILRGKEDA